MHSGRVQHRLGAIGDFIAGKRQILVVGALQNTLGRLQKSLSPLTNHSQIFPEPSERIYYTVGDYHRHFMKHTLPSLCIQHSNLIPPTHFANDFL